MIDDIKIEKPERLAINNVCYWAEKEGILVGNQKSKALKFLKFNCVRKIKDDLYLCYPIPKYNKTTHKIVNGICSCQWRQKENLECSHELAVKLLKLMEKWNNGKQ